MDPKEAEARQLMQQLTFSMHEMEQRKKELTLRGQWPGIYSEEVKLANATQTKALLYGVVGGFFTSFLLKKAGMPKSIL